MKYVKFFLFIILYFNLFAEIEIIPDQDVLPILTPSLSEQQTLKMRLDNGLEVYIISNPHVRKSGAALSVEVGTWQDPDEYPGMAHFCEHMLFMGTEKYPDEAEYHTFIEEHGGSHNAYTTNDHTSYIFSVNNDFFDEALERFSGFFVDPLLKEESMDKEKHAVDQEFGKNRDQDTWRELHVMKELYNPAHPISRFSSGNMETIKGITPEILREWYQQHYSSSKMHLVVCSNQSIEQIKECVVKFFDGVPDNTVSVAEIKQPVHTSDTYGKKIYIDSIQDVRYLTLTWELPEKFAHMPLTRPGSVISYVLGHEGAQSLLAQLKREGLAESLSAGAGRLGDNNVIFSIEISLTDNGMSNVDTIIERCAQAVKYLQEQAMPEYIFKEIHDMDVIAHQFQSEYNVYNMVMQHARNMRLEDIVTYPMETNILQQYDPEAIQEFLQYMTMDRAIISVVAKEALTGIPLQKKDEWTDTGYSVISVTEDALRCWRGVSVHENISIPAANPFIPEDFDLVHNDVVRENKVIPPELLVDDEWGKVYFEEDQRYLVPRVVLDFNLRTALTEKHSAREDVLEGLYLRAVYEQLNNVAYQASMGGLAYSLSSRSRGMSLTLAGYNDKIQAFMGEVIYVMKNCHATVEKFDLYRDSLKRAYENDLLEDPLGQAFDQVRKVLNKANFTSEEKLDALTEVTYEDFVGFCEHLYDQVYIESMMYGNIAHHDAFSLWDELYLTFKTQPLPKEDHYEPQILRLQDDDNPIIITRNTERQGNAVVLVIEEGDFSMKNYVAQKVLSRAVDVPFFNELRTKQQVAYIVGSWSDEIERELMFFFYIQSSTHDTRDLLARFELFFEGYLDDIELNITEQVFVDIKKTFTDSLSKMPSNQGGMQALLDTLAFEYDANFNLVDEKIAAFEELTYEEFIALAKKFLGRENKKRIAVLVNGKIPQKLSLQYVPEKEVDEKRYVPRKNAA
jgi:insulysin